MYIQYTHLYLCVFYIYSNYIFIFCYLCLLLYGLMIFCFLIILNRFITHVLDCHLLFAPVGGVQQVEKGREGWRRGNWCWLWDSVDQGRQEAGSVVLRSGGVTGEWAQRNGTTGLKNKMLIKDLAGGLNALRIYYLSLFLSPSFCFPAGESNKAPSHPNYSEWWSEERKKPWPVKASSLTESEVFVKWLRIL